MPTLPPHACAKPGCPEKVPHGRARCPTHERAKERGRGSAAARGYGRDWQRYRARYLLDHPLCVLCAAAGGVTPATVVDHVVAHKSDEQLFWDPENHRAVCKPHHDARVDEGDFGRVSPAEE
jgi:5-methylcytosine-specific restriction protein A